MVLTQNARRGDRRGPLRLSLSSTPAHEAGVPQRQPVYPPLQAHAPPLQAPWPEQSSPAHGSHAAVLHDVSFAGGAPGASRSQSAVPAAAPPDASHVTPRDMRPPPHVLEHAPHALMPQA